MDYKAISKTIYHKAKSSLGIKTEYGKKFSDYDPFGHGYESEYEFMFFSKPLALLEFKKFLTNTKDIKSVLEIGCSIGLFPRTFSDLFKGLEYTGIDLSKKSIEVCKKYLNYTFIFGDFLKLNMDKKYDFVFSFDVIDHVYDVDLFITKALQTSNKHVCIVSYRGYFPSLTKHRVEYRDDHGIYYNDLSTSQIEKTLLKNNICKDNFSIQPIILRNEMLYDSDLGRIWNKSNVEQQKEIIKLSGLNERILNELPTGLETSTNIVSHCKEQGKIAHMIGLTDDKSSVLRTGTVIRIIK